MGIVRPVCSGLMLLLTILLGRLIYSTEKDDEYLNGAQTAGIMSTRQAEVKLR